MSLDQALANLAGLVERRTGLALADEVIEWRLAPLLERRAAALQLASPAAYPERLAREPFGAAEWRGLIAAIGNGQTSFFRDPEQFAAIAQLLAARRRPARPVWLWSAGCSSGEEAYSLAIVCAELGLAGRARIVASDLSDDFLERARDACFAPWAVRNVDPARRTRWFEPTAGGLRPRAELRQMVELKRHNLVADEPLRPPDGGWHAILCRNVFIYFRRQRVAEATRRLATVLAPDGWLAVAAAETLRGIDAPLVSQLYGGRVFYRAAGADSAPAAAGSPAPVRRAPLESSGWQLDAVIQMARAGRLREAIDLLIAGGERAATIVHHLARGHLHLQLHDIEAALAAYRRAEDIDPLHCEVHFFEGVAHRKAGNWATAADSLRKALFLAPGLWQAAYLLAGVHDRLGRTGEAERMRRRAAGLLRERAQQVAFLSHPVFVEWLSVDEADARRALGVAR